MINPQILGIIFQLNEWDEKLKGIIGDKTSNVGMGTILFFALLLLAFWAIGALNKK